MIETLLSMLGGGALRIVPELIGLWNKKTDNAHELAMVDKQVALENVKAAAQQAVIRGQGDIDQILATLSAQKEAVVSQMQKTGIRLVDTLNFMVRPLTTYYFLTLYGLHKLGTMAVAAQSDDKMVNLLATWTKDDMSILSGILAFWFIGRVFDKK